MPCPHRQLGCIPPQAQLLKQTSNSIPPPPPNSAVPAVACHQSNPMSGRPPLPSVPSSTYPPLLPSSVFGSELLKAHSYSYRWQDLPQPAPAQVKPSMQAYVYGLHMPAPSPERLGDAFCLVSHHVMIDERALALSDYLSSSPWEEEAYTTMPHLPTGLLLRTIISQFCSLPSQATF